MQKTFAKKKKILSFGIWSYCFTIEALIQKETIFLFDLKYAMRLADEQSYSFGVSKGSSLEVFQYTL